MGINLHIYKLRADQVHDYGKPYNCWRQDKVPWWDWFRYSGDKDFVNAIEWDYIDRLDEPYIQYQRPADFEAARKWIRENIQVGPERLLYAMDMMEKDLALAFYICW